MDHSLDQQISSDSGSGQSCPPALLAADDDGPAPAVLNSPPPADGPGRVYWVWAVCGFLLLVVGLVFGQTLWHEFLAYDDGGFVFDNPHVTPGLTISGLWWALTDGPYGDWYPLTGLSHMLDCQLYGLNPAGHFLTNVLLHAASSVLLFLVLLRMTGDLWPSAWVAAVFAIHPLHVESVAWLAERRDVLSGLFFMLTLGAYALYAERPSPSRYLAVFGLFALGLMSKPMLVTVPCVLLLLDYWPLDRFRPPAGADRQAGSRSWLGHLPVAWRLVVEKVPLVALSAVSSGIVLSLHTQMQANDQVDRLSLVARLANALVSYAAYLGQSLYPVNLSPYYPHPNTQLSVVWVAGSLVLLTAITAVAAYSWRRRPYLPVGWLWFLGMLVPVLGLVGTVAIARADRYTYLSQIGLSIALAWGVWGLYQSRQAIDEARWRRWLLAGLSAAAVLLLAAVAWRQTSYWRNTEAVWARAASCTEQNWMAHYCLASIYAREGRTEEAIGHAREALVSDSIARYVTADSHLVLAECLTAQGKIGEALAHFEEAVRVTPNSGRCHSRLAIALARADQLDQAIAEFREAVRLAPADLDARIDLANALLARGELAEAIDQCREVLKNDPHAIRGIILLASALIAGGQVEQAISNFEQAVKIEPQNARAHFGLGQALSDLGRPQSAVAHLNEAIRLQPDNAQMLWPTAWILATSPEASVRDGARAAELATKAIRLSGGQEVRAFDALAAALAETGEYPAAIEAAEQAATMALARNDAALADAIEQRTRLYRQGLPYRQPAIASRE